MRYLALEVVDLHRRTLIQRSNRHALSEKAARNPATDEAGGSGDQCDLAVSCHPARSVAHCAAQRHAQRPRASNASPRSVEA
jgi:hypothetical protein